MPGNGSDRAGDAALCATLLQVQRVALSLPLSGGGGSGDGAEAAAHKQEQEDKPQQALPLVDRVVAGGTLGRGTYAPALGDVAQLVLYVNLDLAFEPYGAEEGLARLQAALRAELPEHLRQQPQPPSQMRLRLGFSGLEQARTSGLWAWGQLLQPPQQQQVEEADGGFQGAQHQHQPNLCFQLFLAENRAPKVRLLPSSRWLQCCLRSMTCTSDDANTLPYPLTCNVATTKGNQPCAPSPTPTPGSPSTAGYPLPARWCPWLSPAPPLWERSLRLRPPQLQGSYRRRRTRQPRRRRPPPRTTCSAA